MYDIVLLASTLLFGALCTLYVRHPAASMFHPATFYLLFHGFVFVFRPIVARVWDFRLVYAVLDFQPSLSDKITAIACANLGLLVFLLVSLRIARRPFELKDRAPGACERERLKMPFLVTAAVLAPLGLWSLVARWNAVATNSLTEAIDPATMVRINTTGVGYFSDLQNVLAPLAAIFAWLFRFKWWSFVPLAMFVFLRAGTGGRGPFVYALAALALLYLLDRRRKWPTASIFALGAATAMLFAAVVSDRGKAIRELVAEDQTTIPELAYERKPLEHMDYANLEYFEYLVYAVPQRSGTHDYFLSYLQLFTEPVPRVLWPDKPAGPPVRPINLFDYGSPMGMTQSLPGAGWYELGWLGIVVHTAVFAALYSLFYRKAARPDASGMYLLFYVLLLATTIIGYRDGSLVSVAKMSLFYQAPVLLMALLLAWDGRPARQGGRPRSGPPASALTPAERRRRIIAEHGLARENGG